MQQLVKNQTVNLSSAPASPLTGDTYYDTHFGAMRIFNGTVWVSLCPVLPITNEYRLSLESGVPISQSDQTAKSTLYWMPYLGNQISLYDLTSGEWFLVKTVFGNALSLSGLTADKNYDVFVFTSTATPSSTNTGTDVLTFGSATGWGTGSQVLATTTGGGLTAGTPYYYRAVTSTTGTLHTTLAGAIANTGIKDLTASITSSLVGLSLELSAAWTNDTTRSDALTLTDGVYTKLSNSSRRWVGTIRSTGTTTTEDSEARRFVYNYQNRVPRKLKKLETTASWTYNSTTWRELNAATNRVSWIDGSGEIPVDLQAQAMFGISTANTHYILGIGYDSTTTSDAELGAQCGGLASLQAVASARLLRANAFGYHYAAAVERCSSAGGNVTIYSNDTRYRTGILGTILN